jgi:ketosteroid isomerase-like protein
LAGDVTNHIADQGYIDMNNEEFVRRAYEIAEVKDIPGWIACFNQDGVFVDESIGVTYSGPSEVAKPVENYGRAFSDMHRELFDIYVRGNDVIVELALQGTHDGPLWLPQGTLPPTGQRMNAPCCDVFRLRRTNMIRDLESLAAASRSNGELISDPEAVAPDTLRPLHHARAIFAAFDAKDIAALAALMTDDVRLQLGNADIVKGKAEFVEALQVFFGSAAAFWHSVIHVWSDVDAVIAELKVHYTRLDGTELTLPCCNVFRLRDGAVTDYRVYMDITPVYAEAQG